MKLLKTQKKRIIRKFLICFASHSSALLNFERRRKRTEERQQQKERKRKKRVADHQQTKQRTKKKRQKTADIFLDLLELWKNVFFYFLRRREKNK